MKNQKGNAVIATILAIVVLLLAGYIVYDKVLLQKENINTQKEENNTNIEETIGNNEKEIIYVEKNNDYTYDKMTGFYKYKDEESSYILYLWENGTFMYEYSNEFYPSGVMGNYTIVDDKILLNYMFTTGSDASIYVKKGSKTIIIKDSNTLLDESTDIEQKRIELNKTTPDENFIKMYDFYNITDTYIIKSHLD